MTLDYPDFSSKSVENLPSLEQSAPTHVFERDDESVTVVETVRGEFVALYDRSDDSREYYVIEPEMAIEASTLGLMNDGWELAEFDAEAADRRVQDTMRREFADE